MAEQGGSDAVSKDEKKERKEREKQQREKEKREKKLEKERKKQEERERKQREKEAKAQQKQQARSSAERSPPPAQNGTAEQDGGTILADGSPEHKRELTAQNGASPNAIVERPTEGHSGSAQPPGAARLQMPPTAVPNGSAATPQPASRPEAVTVAEPPGQISGCGQPIIIVFNATQAGTGALTAACVGAKAGNVATTVTELREGILSVKFTPNVADMYTLHVRWGGKDVKGSPFSLNLNRLSPPAQEGATTQHTKEEEEVEEVSDDPFDMAFQARRLLGECIHCMCKVYCYRQCIY